MEIMGFVNARALKSAWRKSGTQLSLRKWARNERYFDRLAASHKDAQKARTPSANTRASTKTPMKK